MMKKIQTIKWILFIQCLFYLYLFVGLVSGCLDITIPFLFPLGKLSIFEDRSLLLLVEIFLLEELLSGYSALLDDRLKDSIYMHFLIGCIFPICMFGILMANKGFMLISMDVYMLMHIHVSILVVLILYVLIGISLIILGAYCLYHLSYLQKKCPYCGQEIKFEEATYCPHCGRPL